MGVKRIIFLVLGIIVILISAGMLIAGGTLVWVDQALKDDEGFVSTDTINLNRDSYAITTEPADIDLEERFPWNEYDLATIKVNASNNNPGKQIFIGIAEKSDVQYYLNGVDYDEITEFRIHPYRVGYENHPGKFQPTAPVSETFWRASTYGDGTQTLKWELESGSWVLVFMNADGSPGIDLSGTVGAKATWIFGLGIGLLVGGMLLLIIGIVIVYFSVRRPRVKIIS